MADVAIANAAEPDGAARIAVLDILRGVAILGILFMNINAMGQSIRASFFDIRHLGWSPTDQIAWWLRAVLADGTARCLLELLFGAGMVILTDRAAARIGDRMVWRHYAWRNIILFGFGLVHIFVLLWPGDILHTYGIAAIVAVLFRTLRPRVLILLGLSAAMFGLMTGTVEYYGSTMQRGQIAALSVARAAGATMTAGDRALLAEDAKRTAEQAGLTRRFESETVTEDRDRSAATGNFVSWVRSQWGAIIEVQMMGLEILGIWEAVAVMLIGAALFRLGVLQGARSRRFYLGLTIAGYAIGIALRVLQAYATTRFDSAPTITGGTYEIARLAMTLGHVGLINLLVTTAFGQRVLRPFVAAGRTALSIYIAQTLICLWVLYPPFMLGLYGKTSWAPLMLTAFAINAALLVGANIWVRHFDIAPVEWAWRSLVERRALPWRRHARPSSAIGSAPATA